MITENSSAGSARDIARAMLASQHPVTYPMITRCALSSPGLPAFTEGSPHLLPDTLERFCRAMREDIGLMAVEPARAVFRHIDRAEPYPVPESCTPYIDANSLGFYLKPFLPLVFVRTTKGELLLEARVALKYLRENARRFSSVLDTIAYYASRLFRPDAYAVLQAQYPRLVADVVQPYSSFTDNHLSMRAGLWVHTPPGMSTVIGPPVNQHGPLSILTGAIETDWHHFELFVVAQVPPFEGQVLLIEPETVLAQLYFISRTAQEHTEIRFASHHPGAEPGYWAAWEQLGQRLVEGGKGKIATRHGTASVNLSCPHCYVSVTAAAEDGVSEAHVLPRGFNPAYKMLKQEYRHNGERLNSTS